MPQIQEQIVVLAVDVPVTMQLEHQQSKLENPEVPQFLFIGRVPDIPAATQRRVRAVQNCAENRQDSTGAVLGMVVDVPVVLQRQVLGVGQCRKTVEVPQLQSVKFLERLLTRPLLYYDRCLVVQPGVQPSISFHYSCVTWARQ